MGLFNKLGFGKSKEEKPKAAPKPKKAQKTAKELATEKGEPWVNIESIELDPDNIGNGAFELDWNEIFVAKLVKAGYKGRDDVQIVDQWFQDVCRNVLMENYEQWEANQPPEARIIQRRDLGGGRTEIS